MAENLNDIATYGKRYIGFVYADGNGLGEWINDVDRFDEYSQRSQAVHESVSKAVYKAIHCHLGQKKFEVVTIGGDDAIIIVPGQWALAIARDICREFCAQMGEHGYPDLTMSAGVVIADSHTPVYFLRLIAENLLKSAKGEVTDQGTVDFLVLRNQTILATDLAHLRGTEPWCISDPVELSRLFLSYGPYTLTELDQLLGLVCHGREVGFSRSQLHTLNQSLKRGRSASNLLFLYQKARAREAIRKFIRAFEEQFCPRSEQDTLPWQKTTYQRGRHEYRTAWADMVEIWDLAQEGNNAHTD